MQNINDINPYTACLSSNIANCKEITFNETIYTYIIIICIKNTIKQNARHTQKKKETKK